MRDLKLKSVVEKVNEYLKGRNYRYEITAHEKGYEQKLFQGTHQVKFQVIRKESFDSRYARYIKEFIFEILEREFYKAVFGELIHVRLDIIPLTEHPEEYLKRHKFNIVHAEPVPIGDCWLLDIIDEGLPLTEHMTKI